LFDIFKNLGFLINLSPSMTSASDFLPLLATANPLAHLLNGQHSWALGFGVLLLGVSLFAWSVIASKTMGLRRSNRNDKIFLKHFRDSAHPLQVYGSNARAQGSVLHEVYTSGAEELTYHWLGSSEVDGTFEARLRRAASMSKRETALFRTRLRRIADESGQRIESRMQLVTCLVNSVPLLGLLATAWGLMAAFSGSNSANLASAQPSIGTSISLTVLALLIAVPASIGARFLREKLQRKSREVRHFCQELDASISTAYLNGSDAKGERSISANASTTPAAPEVTGERICETDTKRVMEEEVEMVTIDLERPAATLPVAAGTVSEEHSAAPISGQQLTFEDAVEIDDDEQFTSIDQTTINPVARQTAQAAPGLLFEPQV